MLYGLEKSDHNAYIGYPKPQCNLHLCQIWDILNDVLVLPMELLGQSLKIHVEEKIEPMKKDKNSKN